MVPSVSSDVVDGVGADLVCVRHTPPAYGRAPWAASAFPTCGLEDGWSASAVPPARASPRSLPRSPRRTTAWSCRWTASTSPTSSSRGAGCWTARVRRRRSTPRGTPPCWPGSARRPEPRGAGARVRPVDSSSRSPAPIPVPPAAGLVVTEGNYLLLDEPRWRAVRAELDEVWHVARRRGGPARAAGRPARRVRQGTRRGPGLGRPGRPAQRRARRGGRRPGRPASSTSPTGHRRSEP